MDDRPSLYDDDIVAWAEEQATALRALAARGDISNVLDWENVIEEIESVGRSHIRAVESLLIQALAHMLKHLSAPDLPTARHWREEIGTLLAAARNRFERSMRQRIDLDRVWKSAQETASLGLTPYGDTLLPNLPEICPIDLDALLASPSQIDGLLIRIANAIGRPPNA